MVLAIIFAPLHQREHVKKKLFLWLSYRCLNHLRAKLIKHKFFKRFFGHRHNFGGAGLSGDCHENTPCAFVSRL
jgi:hypothetical protein